MKTCGVAQVMLTTMMKKDFVETAIKKVVNGTPSYCFLRSPLQSRYYSIMNVLHSQVKSLLYYVARFQKFYFS